MNDKEVAIVLTGGEGENSKVIMRRWVNACWRYWLTTKIYVNAPCGGRGTVANA